MTNPQILAIVRRLNILRASVERKAEQLQSLESLELKESVVSRQQKYEWAQEKKHSLRRVQALFNSVLEDLSAYRLTVEPHSKAYAPDVESCGVIKEEFADVKKE